VLPDLGNDIVLGMPFLAEYNPYIDFAARELTFANGQRVTCVPPDSTIPGVV